MLTNYRSFILEKLKFEIFSILEGSIYASTDFIMKLKSISKRTDNIGVIASNLLSIIESEKWIDSQQIKANYFDLVDQKEDMVSFINNDKVHDSDLDLDSDPSLPYSMKGRGEIKIGKVFNYLTQLTGISLSDKEREEFVNIWKSDTEKPSFEFKLVSGDDISKYYNEKKYYSGGGTLGSSCMRDVSKRQLKIYTENPDKVKLLIYVDGDDKIHGRALVWKVKKSPCQSKFFMDRIYTSRDSDVNRFKKFADDHDWFYKKNQNSYVKDAVKFLYKGQLVWGQIKINLNADFTKFPFLDTLCFLNKDCTVLSNIPDRGDYFLHSVYGDAEVCNYCGGKVLKKWGKTKILCTDCADGHSKLAELGIQTKWNRRVDDDSKRGDI